MTTQEKLVALAGKVQERGSKWALVVPAGRDDEEWIVKLGSLEIVAGDLDGALDLAIEVAGGAS